MDEGMIVYIKPGCPWCDEAEDYLKEHGYQYERVNVNADRDAYAYMRKISGQSCAPTLTVGGKLLADFGADELEEFLQENNIKP
jgi:glutaredoxin 3